MYTVIILLAHTSQLVLGFNVFVFTNIISNEQMVHCDGYQGKWVCAAHGYIRYKKGRPLSTSNCDIKCVGALPIDQFYIKTPSV